VECDHARAEPFVGIRMLASEPRHDRTQLVARCGRAHAGNEPPGHEQQMRVADGRDVTREREAARDAAVARDPQLDVGHHRNRETGRQHADDRVSASVEDQLLSSRGRR
jgi:hypothetical protein